MGKHRNKNIQTPVATTVAATPEPQAVQTTPPAAEAPKEAVAVATIEAPKEVVAVATTEAPKAPPKDIAAKDEIYQLLIAQLDKMSPAEKAKVQPYLEKLKADSEKLRASNAAPAFNIELEKELPLWLEALAKKHSYSLLGRKITVIYPKNEGKELPKPSNTPVGAKAGNGGGHGFPLGYGIAAFQTLEGKEVIYQSSSALAKALNLQIEGMRDMVDVFQNPTKPHGKGEAKVADPRKFTVDADKAAKRFIVTQTA